MKMKKGSGIGDRGSGRFLGGIVRGFLAAALCAVGLSAMAVEPADTVVYGTNPYVIEKVAEGTTLDASKLPTAEKPVQIENVTFRQRCWPWSGEVDVSFDMTGPAGIWDIIVTAYTNGTEKIDSFTATVTIPAEEFLTANLVWDAEALGADFKSDDVTVEVALAQPVQLWEGGPYFAIRNVGAKAPEDYGWYFWWGDTVGYKRNAANNGWVSVVDGTTPIQFSNADPTASQNRGMNIATLMSEGWIDDSGNLAAAHDAATVKLGAPWRMMTKEEAAKLADKEICECTSNWQGRVVGCLLRGKTTGYTDKSIFIPGVGYGQNSSLGSLNSVGVYWTSSPHPDDRPGRAWYLNPYSNCNFIKTNHYDRCYGGTVRPVRDTPLPPASATSEKGTVDVREAVALAVGEVTIPNVTYSATLWGEVPETSTTVGWKNLMTGATGAFGNLSNITGEDAKAVTLPTENGDYVLTHSTGDLTSFVTFTVSGYPIVRIPAAQGCTYVVSNLTTGAEIPADEGDRYTLPVGSTVSISCVPEEGYEVVGANPYVIDSVPAGITALEESKLPTAVREGTLCLTAVSDNSTVWMKKVGSGWTPPTVQYLIEGKGWNTVTYVQKLKLSKGEKVWFRGDNPDGFSYSDWQYVGFTLTGQVAASGSVMSLIDPTLETTAIPCNYCFTSLFYYCPALTAAPELPATELKANCYDCMFYSCTSLTTAPELPATELKSYCYNQMFDGCSSLNQVRVGFSAWEPNATQYWLRNVATKGTFFHTAPLDIPEYGSSTVPEGWAVVPWYVGASDPMDALAWVDEALKAVVIDNGMPGATNAIDLVTLADEMTKFGYEPAEKLANVFLTYASEDGEVAYLKPVEWFDADDVTKTYPTLDVALEAGVTAVLPNFVTEKIPQVIAKQVVDGYGNTHAARVMNAPADEGVAPVHVADLPEGLDDVVKVEMEDVQLVVKAMGEESVESSETLVEVLSQASGAQPDSVTFVDLSVWVGSERKVDYNAPTLLTIRIPWDLDRDCAYAVARTHDGKTASIPEGAENATTDQEYFTVDYDKGQIVLHVKYFSDYAIGETDKPNYTLLLAAELWLYHVAPQELKEPLAAFMALSKLTYAFSHSDTLEQYLKLKEGEEFAYDPKKLVEFGSSDEAAFRNYMFVSGLIGLAELERLTSGEMPLGWRDARNPLFPVYATLEDAFAAGVRTVLPVYAKEQEPEDEPYGVGATGAVTAPKAVASTGLLKEKTTATWKAKASDACVFVGWKWARGMVRSSAFKALSENELKNPTLKLKIAAGEKVLPTDLEATWAWIDEDALGEVALTATGLEVESKSYVTATVSGLPTGLKFDKNSLAITGKAKKNGTKTVKVTVKNASGYKVTQTYEMTISGGAVTGVVRKQDERTGSPVVVSGDASLGKVKGSKVYVAGKKVSLKATPAKGSIFLGWYEDAAFTTPAKWLPKGYQTASQSVVVPAEGMALFARFVQLAGWAVGNFSGDYYEDGKVSGTAKLTVGSTGKVSGKVTTGGKSQSFSAKSFDDAVEQDGKLFLVAHPTMKVGGEATTLRLLVGEDESGKGIADIAYGDEEAAPFATLRSVK